MFDAGKGAHSVKPKWNRLRMDKMLKNISIELNLVDLYLYQTKDFFDCGKEGTKISRWWFNILCCIMHCRCRGKQCIAKDDHEERYSFIHT